MYNSNALLVSKFRKLNDLQLKVKSPKYSSLFKELVVKEIESIRKQLK